MTKEEILDKHYQPGMHWKVVNRAKVLQAIDECTAPLEARIRELEEGLRELRRCSPVLRGDTFVCITPVKEYVNAYKDAQSLISL